MTRDFRGYDVTKWHHLGCFPVESDPIDSVEDIGGFSSLEVSLYLNIRNFQLRGYSFWMIACPLVTRISETDNAII